MTHVKPSPYYSQSNGKIKRWHHTIKQNCIGPNVPLSLEEAQRLVERFIGDYNYRTLHRAIGYVTPADILVDCEQAIFDETQ